MLLTASAFWVPIAAIAVWCFFAAVRPSFLNAMVRSRQVSLLRHAYELERLVDAGEIESDSAFYRYYAELARTFSRTSPEDLPGLGTLLIMLVTSAVPPTSTQGTALQSSARAEAHGRYLKHEDLRLCLYADIAEMYRYRSILVWAFIKAAEHGALGALDALLDGLVQVGRVAEFNSLRQRTLA